MGAISYYAPLAVETKTSKQRRATPNPRKGKIGVKGYTKDMVKNFLKDKLAPKIKDMKVKEVIVCMDKGLSFKEKEAKEQLLLGGAVMYGFYLQTLLRMLAHLTTTSGTHSNSVFVHVNQGLNSELLK
jgi:hypothetical protein